MNGNLTAWLTINHICNLNCKWCYQRELSDKSRSMSGQLMFKLIPLFSDLAVKNVILIGGEPTIHPLFLDAVKLLTNKGMIPKVVSNSLRFSDMSFVKKAKDAGVNTVVSSVKGFTEEQYESATGVRAFERTRRAIANLEKSGIKHRISIVITASVIREWKSVIEFVKSCDTQDFSFSFEKPCLVGNDIVFKDGILPRQISEYIETLIYPTLVKTRVPFKLDLMFPQCQLPESFLEKLEREGRVFSGCHFLNHRSVIFDPEGQVLPCNHFATLPIGKYGVDFSTTGEYYVWRKKYADSQDFKFVSSAPCERCGSCKRWNKCGAGCRLFWLFKGDKVLLPTVCI